jgi:hypothetical protein
MANVFEWYLQVQGQSYEPVENDSHNGWPTASPNKDTVRLMQEVMHSLSSDHKRQLQ